MCVNDNHSQLSHTDKVPPYLYSSNINKLMLLDSQSKHKTIDQWLAFHWSIHEVAKLWLCQTYLITLYCWKVEVGDIVQCCVQLHRVIQSSSAIIPLVMCFTKWGSCLTPNSIIWYHRSTALTSSALKWPLGIPLHGYMGNRKFVLQ